MNNLPKASMARLSQAGRETQPMVFVVSAIFLFMAPVCLTPAMAQSSDDSSYTSEQVEACADDAIRLCSDLIPSVSRVRQCMIEKKALLSKRCQAMFK